MKNLTKTATGFGLLGGLIMVGAAIFGAIADRKDFNEQGDFKEPAALNNSGKEEPTKVICEGITEPETYVDAAPTEEEQ